VEQHYRDSRLNLIHEGTQGVQALDLLGRKVVMQNGAGLSLLGSIIGATVALAEAAGGKPAALASQLRATWGDVVSTTAVLWEAGDVSVTLANATVYLEAVGHVVMSWIWLEQLLAPEGREGDFYEGRHQADRYFFLHELPRTAPQLALLRSLDTTNLDGGGLVLKEGCCIPELSLWIRRHRGQPRDELLAWAEHEQAPKHVAPGCLNDSSPLCLGAATRRSIP
jgi:hypothetical protein